MGSHPLEVAQSPAAPGGGGAGLPEGSQGLGPCRQFTVVLEIAGFNATPLSAYCRKRGLVPDHGDR